MNLWKLQTVGYSTSVHFTKWRIPAGLLWDMPGIMFVCSVCCDHILADTLKQDVTADNGQKKERTSTDDRGQASWEIIICEVSVCVCVCVIADPGMFY